MKKKIFLVMILCMAAAVLSAEVFRMGGIGSLELMENPLNEETQPEFTEDTNFIPGFYWEVILGRLGFGMTYLADFTPLDSKGTDPDLEYEWLLDWIGSWDFRYHFFGDFPVDPFVELAFGNAGRVELTENAMDEAVTAGSEPLLLSLFLQAGGGAALRLGNIHLGAKVLYRISNEPIPAAQFEVYPLKNFQLGFFGGFSF